MAAACLVLLQHTSREIDAEMSPSEQASQADGDRSPTSPADTDEFGRPLVEDFTPKTKPVKKEKRKDKKKKKKNKPVAQHSVKPEIKQEEEEIDDSTVTFGVSEPPREDQLECPRHADFGVSPPAQDTVDEPIKNDSLGPTSFVRECAADGGSVAEPGCLASSVSEPGSEADADLGSASCLPELGVGGAETSNGDAPGPSSSLGEPGHEAGSERSSLPDAGGEATHGAGAPAFSSSRTAQERWRRSVIAEASGMSRRRYERLIGLARK